MAESTLASSILPSTNLTNGSRLDSCETVTVQFYWIASNIPPSIILLLVATFCQCQPNTFKWYRRPKLVYPLNLLDGFSDRLPYVFAFLVTSNVVINLLQLDPVDQYYLDDLSTSVRFLVWALIKYVYIVIAGLVFYPLLLCITYRNFLTDVLGFIFTCNWFAMYVYIYTLCPVGSREGILNGFSYIPSLISCFGLVSFFVWRIVKRFEKTCIKWRNKSFSLMGDGTDERFMHSHYAERVRYLLTRTDRRQGNLEPKGKDKVKQLMRRIYPAFPGFRYSTRIVCTFGLTLIVLYQMSLIYITQTLKSFQDIVLKFFSTSADLIKFFDTIELAFNLSSYPAMCISFINCLLLLRNYRENTRELWKGDRSRLQSHTSAPYSIIVSCLSFSSFSVAYTFYGFLVLQVMLWTVMSCVVVIIRYNLLIELLQTYWSHVFLVVFLVVIQQLLARFVLIQRNTNGALVINNRRLFHIIIHFFFFLNIIVGLVGCLLRIIKVAFIGILLIGRVDLCLAPRGFEWADKGFGAYRSFLELEVSLTHPVVVTFCHLLNQLRGRKRITSGDADIERQDLEAEVDRDVAINDVATSWGATGKTSSSRRVKNRWLKAYTMIRNKRLVYERLHKLDESREEQHDHNICQEAATV